MALFDFEGLEQKMDKIIAQNDEILSIFKKVGLYPKDPTFSSPPKRSKNDWAEQFAQDYFRAMPHQKALQEAFNLTVVPSTQRVLKYLDTNDPKAFDGLKRNTIDSVSQKVHESKAKPDWFKRRKCKQK